MKNNIKHPHFKHEPQDYLKGLIAKDFTLKEVVAHTGYTISYPDLS